VIAEDGPRVLVVDRGNGPPAVLAFVAGVVALVFGGFGAVSLAAVLAAVVRPTVRARRFRPGAREVSLRLRQRGQGQRRGFVRGSRAEDQTGCTRPGFVSDGALAEIRTDEKCSGAKTFDRHA